MHRLLSSYTWSEGSSLAADICSLLIASWLGLVFTQALEVFNPFVTRSCTFDVKGALMSIAKILLVYHVLWLVI